MSDKRPIPKRTPTTPPSPGLFGSFPDSFPCSPPSATSYTPSHIDLRVSHDQGFQLQPPQQQQQPNQQPPASPTSPARKLTILNSPSEPQLSLTAGLKRSAATFWASGRPPWYDKKGNVTKKTRPMVIGVSGGTSSGKTTVCHAIVQALDVPWAVILSQDSFYKNLEGEDLIKAKNGDYDFDHPDAFDYELMVHTLQQLLEGNSVQVPIYDFTTHTRKSHKQHIYGADVILFEGILVFWSKQLRELMDLLIFVHTDSDIRLARRLRRDIAERGRDLDGVLKQYERFVKPAFEDYIDPTRRFANIIIPNGTANPIAINLITQHIKTTLEQKGTKTIRDVLAAEPTPESMPDSLTTLPATSNIRSIHTILRDRNTPREAFVFHATRLARLLIESALSLLPFDERVVVTPTQSKYVGSVSASKLCGVSIMRAGESMEVALREVCKDITIGKVLIQTHPESGDPQLIYTKLPADVTERFVLLMDPMIGTGATAMMAVRVLLDHGVPPERIAFLTLIAAPGGIHNLAYCYPDIKILTTCVDDCIDENFFIRPGVGNFGDRYFGTD